MKVLMLFVILLLAPIFAVAQPAKESSDEKPCSAIETLMAYESVAATEDAKEAGTQLELVDVWYRRCKSRLLDSDRKWIDIRAMAAKESLSWPRTLVQAVDQIVDGMSDEEQNAVKSKPRENLIEFHMGWGMGIRNGLGLWRGNDALVISACGGERCHPDDASMKIIEAVWERLQHKPPPTK